jgi:hypothetical protein
MLMGDKVSRQLQPLKAAAPIHESNGESIDNSPSLDRIDTSKGYVKGNVWVISWRANKLKSDATLAELESIVLALRNRLQGENT